MVFNIDRSITTVTISVTVSTLELVVATNQSSKFYTLQDAIDASSPGDEIELIKTTTEDVTLLTPVSINFNQNTLTGNLSINFTDDTTITFSGLGTLTGDLTIDAPSLTLNSDLNVSGDTNIIAIGSNSFNTSGVHTGVITLSGPGRINALNQVSRPSIRINTTSPVQIDGFVEDIDVDIDDVVVTINAALTRIRLNQRSTSQLTFGQGINFSRENLVFNQRLQRYYDSIQAAIDGASSGDTIEVGPGVYNESLTLNKSITLSGVNAGVSFDGDRPTESIISGGVITFSAVDVTFDGFKLLNTFLNRFTNSANGLSILNSIIHHEFILESYENVGDRTGDRMMIKGQSNVSGVTIENVQLIGPGQNAAVDDNPIDNNKRIGGIDFNGVLNSTIKNVSINDISRYGINIGGNSTGIVIDGYQANRVGTSDSFMAALYFANVTENAVTLKGNHIYDAVNIGVSLVGSISDDFFTTTEKNVTLSGFNLTITNATIAGFGTSAGSFITTTSSNFDVSYTDTLAKAMGFEFGYVVSDAAIEPAFPYTFYSFIDVGPSIPVPLPPLGAVEFKRLTLVSID
jgi:hypothetical protein